MVRFVSRLHDVRLSIISAAAGLCWIAGGATPASAEPLGPWSGSQIAMAGASEVWRTQLPLGFSPRIVGYHLAGDHLYAIGDDGLVRAIRADDGRHVWTGQLAAPFETIWPPVPTYLKGKPAVVFTLLREAVFLDPPTGEELKRVPFIGVTTTAGAAASEKNLFPVGLDKRIRCIRIKDGVKVWATRTPATIDLPVVYRPDGDEVVVLDTRGTMASLDSAGKKHFMRNLQADPGGPIAVDRMAFYLVTTDGVLHAVERRTGSLLWHYRLVERPAGGPVATRTALYQATATGGLYRFEVAGTAALATRPAGPPGSEDAAAVTAAIPDEVPTTQPGKSPRKITTQPAHDWPRIDADREIRRWYYPLGLKFLAEWPERIVVLQTDGHIGLVPLNSRTGEPAEILDLGPIEGAVSNTFNDAVYLTSPTGMVRCLRPVGAAPLNPADFGVVPTTQPATSQPAATQAAVAPRVPSAAAAQGQPVPQAPQPASAPSRAGEGNSLTDPLRSHKVLAQ